MHVPFTPQGAGVVCVRGGGGGGGAEGTGEAAGHLLLLHLIHQETVKFMTSA